MGKCMSSAQREHAAKPKTLNTENNVENTNIAKNESSDESLCSLSSPIMEIAEISDSFHVSLQSSYHNLLGQCQNYHSCNLDKLHLNKLCIACNGYYKELHFYLKVIENDKNLNNLEALKYILLSYLIHSKIEYYTKIKNAYPKYQIIMDDWNKFALNHSKLKRSINILKKQIKVLNMDDFINLLFKLQPWMNAKDLWSIIQFQKKNNVLCNGCGAAKLKGNFTICWVCHIAIKIVFLLYFTINLWLDEAKYFDEITGYIKSHHVAACDWFWNLNKSYRYIQLFGNHIIPNHIINKMRKEKTSIHLDEETFVKYCIKPPIVAITTFKTIQTDYMMELKNGYKVSSQNASVLSVSMVNELGAINVYRL